MFKSLKYVFFTLLVSMASIAITYAGDSGYHYEFNFSIGKGLKKRTVDTLDQPPGQLRVVSKQVATESINVKQRYFWLALVIALSFNLFRRVRARSNKTEVTRVPVFKPPKGFTPAALRYLKIKQADARVLFSAIISIAAKGYLSIEQTRDFQMTLYKEQGTGRLGKSERVLYDNLFLDDITELKIEKDNKGIILAAKKQFEKALFDEHSAKFFIFNATAYSILIFITAYCMIFGAIASSSLNVMIIAAVAISIMVLKMRLYYDPAVRTPNLTVVRLAFYVGIPLLLFLPFFTIAEKLVFVLIALITILNLSTFKFLKAYTLRGEKLLSKIGGYKMFLDNTMRNKMSIRDAEQQMPDFFVNALPYAIAFEAETKWSDSFHTAFYNAGFYFESVEERPSPGITHPADFGPHMTRKKNKKY